MNNSPAVLYHAGCDSRSASGTGGVLPVVGLFSLSPGQDMLCDQFNGWPALLRLVSCPHRSFRPRRLAFSKR